MRAEGGEQKAQKFYKIPCKQVNIATELMLNKKCPPACISPRQLKYYTEKFQEK